MLLLLHFSVFMLFISALVSLVITMSVLDQIVRQNKRVPHVTPTMADLTMDGIAGPLSGRQQ